MIGLGAQEVKFVLKVVALPSELHRRLMEASETGLELWDDEADLLLDLASDQLMTHGFDAAYRPTQTGRALERLVDRLSTDDDANPVLRRPRQ